MDEGARRGGLVGPLILIGLGILFLLANLGVVTWSFWEIIFRLWPLLLIAWGLEILFGRRAPWVSVVIVLVVITVAGASLWFIEPGGPGGQPVTTTEVSQSLDGAARADVQISSGVGTLRIDPMQTPDMLIEGTVVLPGRQQLVSKSSVAGDTLSYRLRTENGASIPFTSSWGADRGWDLRLTSQVPMNLTVNTGVGEAHLELRQMQLTGLTVSTGVGKTTITLPAKGQFSVQVSGGVGETIIQIPSEVAARIRVDGGLGDVRVDGTFAQEDRVYTSANYATAKDRVDIQVSGGVGRIAVRQVGA